MANNRLNFTLSITVNPNAFDPDLACPSPSPAAMLRCEGHDRGGGLLNGSGQPRLQAWFFSTVFPHRQCQQSPRLFLGNVHFPILPVLGSIASRLERFG